MREPYPFCSKFTVKGLRCTSHHRIIRETGRHETYLYIEEVCYYRPGWLTERNIIRWAERILREANTDPALWQQPSIWQQRDYL